MKIKRLRWNEWNIEHIQRHGVNQGEVEEICYSKHFAIKSGRGKMAKKITLKGKKIPKFKSYEEEANFWDTHSPLDYGTWKEVKLEFAKPLEHILGVRLDAKTLTQLTKLGMEMGLGPSTLVRTWIMEKLKFLLKKSRQSELASHAALHKITSPKSFRKG